MHTRNKLIDAKANIELANHNIGPMTLIDAINDALSIVHLSAKDVERIPELVIQAHEFAMSYLNVRLREGAK